MATTIRSPVMLKACSVPAGVVGISSALVIVICEPGICRFTRSAHRATGAIVGPDVCPPDEGAMAQAPPKRIAKIAVRVSIFMAPPGALNRERQLWAENTSETRRTPNKKAKGLDQYVRGFCLTGQRSCFGEKGNMLPSSTFQAVYGSAVLWLDCRNQERPVR